MATELELAGEEVLHVDARTFGEWSMSGLADVAKGKGRGSDAKVASLANAWAEALSLWDAETAAKERRSKAHAAAAAAARDHAAGEQRRRTQERSRQLLEAADEMERTEAAEAAEAAKQDGGDVASSAMSTPRRSSAVPRPPTGVGSGQAGRPLSASGTGRRSTAPLATPPAARLTRPGDVEPVLCDWLPPHATADATAARAAHDDGDFATAVRHWNAALSALMAAGPCAGNVSSVGAPAGVAVVLGNRAASLMRAGCFEAAASDCSSALAACPSHAVSNARLARCHLVLGNYRAAKQLLSSVPQSRWPFDLAPDLAAADALSQYDTYLDHGNVAAALDTVTRVAVGLSAVGGEMAFELLRLEALGIVAPDDVLDEARVLVDAHPTSPDARYWLALYLFRSDATGKTAQEAHRVMQEAMRLAENLTVTVVPYVAPTPTPLHHRAAKSEGPPVPSHVAERQQHRQQQQQQPQRHQPRRLPDIHKALAALAAAAPLISTITNATTHGRWAQAVQACNAAMQADVLGHRKLRSYILLCRAKAGLAQFRGSAAVSDCTDGLLVVDSPFVAELYTVRSDAYAATCDWVRAHADAREAYRLNPTTAAFERVEATRAAAERAARPAGGDDDGDRGGSRTADTEGGGTTRSSSFWWGQRGGRPRPESANSTSRGTGGTSGSSGRSAPPPPSPRQPYPKTHYETLSVARDADRKTIARAYRDMALQWHPDRWSGKSETERRVSEDRFKAIGNAYGVLSDPGSRAAYDRTLPTVSSTR